MKEKANGSVSPRKQRLRWLVTLSSVPLFGVVAAFGVAPQTLTEQVAVSTVVENLSLPEIAQRPGPAQEFWREERMQRGDTIGSILARLQVYDPEAARSLRSSREARSLYQLTPGTTVYARVSDTGELLSLRYAAGDKLSVIEKDGKGFKTTEHRVQGEQRFVMRSGEIKSSLFAATDAAGLPESVATQLSEIFSGDVDFHDDLRKGDKFTVIFETFHHNGEPVRVGRLLAVELINRGKSHKAIYFDDGQGHGGYYTPEGKSLRKAFLRSPLEFSRITSGFSEVRFHPILQSSRAHKGIDYGAPMGTRIKAVADGTVAFAARQNGYGNVVILEHRSGYSTVYGHLSDFAPGVQKGQKVIQGDVIGYVGMTGLATGPHLHFEFKVDGEQRNPLAVAIPSTPPITPQLKAAFDNTAKPLVLRLALLRETNLAQLD